MYENRKYLIFPVTELFKVDFNQVGETSSETVRKSVDETYTFVKWEGQDPTFISEFCVIPFSLLILVCLNLFYRIRYIFRL